MAPTASKSITNGATCPQCTGIAGDLELTAQEHEAFGRVVTLTAFENAYCARFPEGF
jgi:hypothetical protein